MESPKRIEHSEDLPVDGRIILKYVPGIYSGSVWIRFIWLTIGTGGRLRGNKPVPLMARIC
jgi:hypothetical protein